MHPFASFSEPQLRLLVFLCVFLSVGLLEYFFPRITTTNSKWARWYSNIGISALNTILLKILLPWSAVEFARLMEQNQLGVLPVATENSIVNVLVTIVLLDFIVYLQHYILHYFPLLWRLHRVHHADTQFDQTTGLRFHPLEMLFSMAIKFSAIFLFGLPAMGVLIFEILLNGFSLFSHGNFRIPIRVDRILRWLIVTPEMHRIHHSSRPEETNSNYGFQLSLWDRLFGTYRSTASAEITIGLEYFREKKFSHLSWMLVNPFLRAEKK